MTIPGSDASEASKRQPRTRWGRPAAADPDLLDQVAFASFNRSEQFRLLGCTEVASSGFAEVADRFLKETEPRVLRIGIAARVEQAMLHAHGGDFGSAFDLLDALLTRVGDSEEAALQEEIARGMREYARVLAGLDKLERARDIKAEIQERFGGSDDPNVRRFLTQVDDLIANPTLF